MDKNNFIERFVKEFRDTLLTKEKITDLGIHVIVMFTFVSSLYFYVTSPEIGYRLGYAIELLLWSLNIPYSLTGTCPNNRSIKELKINYKKLYDRDTLNNNLVYILGCYFVWFVLLSIIVSFVWYNRIPVKWIIITNLCLMAFLGPVEYYFIRTLGRFSFYNPKKLLDKFFDTVAAELKSNPLYE